MVIPVPSGEHIVEVEFGSTPPRTVATFISITSLIMALVITWRMSGSKKTKSHRSFHDWPVLITILAISAITIFFLEPFGLLRHNSSGRTAEPAQNTLYADFGEQIALLGFDIKQQMANPGDLIDLTLYWKAQQTLDINYQVFVHVFGPDGLVAQSDKLNPGDFPTKRWPKDKYVRDEHQIMLPDDLAAGEYEIAVGVWVQADGWRLPLLDENGNQQSDRFTIFTLLIESGQHRP